MLWHGRTDLSPVCLALAPDPVTSPVRSPCTKDCVLAPDRRTCLGCARTVEEIMAWQRADEDYRRAVLARIAATAKAESESGSPESGEPPKE